jgi:hypothetical protein
MATLRPAPCLKLAASTDNGTFSSTPCRYQPLCRTTTRRARTGLRAAPSGLHALAYGPVIVKYVADLELLGPL